MGYEKGKRFNEDAAISANNELNKISDEQVDLIQRAEALEANNGQYKQKMSEMEGELSSVRKKDRANVAEINKLRQFVFDTSTNNDALNKQLEQQSSTLNQMLAKKQVEELSQEIADSTRQQASEKAKLALKEYTLTADQKERNELNRGSRILLLIISNQNEGLPVNLSGLSAADTRSVVKLVKIAGDFIPPGSKQKFTFSEIWSKALSGTMNGK